MKKSTKVVLNLFLAGALLSSLAACGSMPNTDATSTNKENVSTTSTSTRTASESTDQSHKISTPVEVKAKEELSATKEVKLTLEGMEEIKTGSLFTSEQGYYMYVIPRFSAEAEEPGKDIILTDIDNRHTMQIQVMDKDASLEELKQNAKEELTLLGDVHEMKEEQIADSFFRSAYSYQFASDGEVTRVIIIQTLGDQTFRFTLQIANTESAEGVIPSFWAMIKTIGLLK